jgi:hypothetical protein
VSKKLQKKFKNSNERRFKEAQYEEWSINNSIAKITFVCWGI